MPLDARLADLMASVGADVKALASAMSSERSTVTVGPTRIPIGVDAQYAAFPSITKLTDGRVLMVWYQATNHASARDGDILASVSDDRGKSWGSPTVAVSGSGDYRDPAIRLIGDRLYLTYFKGTAINAADGCFLRISTNDGATWGTEIRIDSGQQYSAITAPVVDLGGGVLMVVWYGKTLTADARESVWSATSTDGGATWATPVKRVDGVALGFAALEPWLSKFGNTLVITYRVNNAQDVGRIVSTNNGATWSAHATVIKNATGRPSTLFTSDGTLLVTYRSLSSPLSIASGLIRYSRDNGATWSGPRVLETGWPSWWLYSDMCEVDPGIVIVPSGVEESSTAARISCRYVTVGSATTPFGDAPETPLVSTPDIVDDFDRPDSSDVGYARTGHRWSATAGWTIKDGNLSSLGNGTTGFRYAVLDAKSVNLEIEADWCWAANAGVGLVFRWVDGNNHLYVTSETSGANLRLYQRANGVATVLQQAAYPLNTGVYHRVRVVDNGGVIRVYADGHLVLTHVLAAGTSPVCGVQASTVGASDHRFRRFSVRRRGALV